MSTINQLTAVETLAAGDALPVYSQAQGDARRSSLTTLVAFLSTAFASLTASRSIKVSPCLVAQLPSGSTLGIGARAYVTDASATTFNSTVAGGGSNKVPVHWNGTNWVIG